MTTTTFHGVSVRLEDNALHAVGVGFFPFSPSGYRSLASERDHSMETLERIAHQHRELLKSTPRRVRGARVGVDKARNPQERLSWLISLSLSVEQAASYVFLARRDDQEALLRELGSTIDTAGRFLDDGYAAADDPKSHWTADAIADAAIACLDLCRAGRQLLERLRKGPLSPVDWARFACAVPHTHLVPQVVRAMVAGIDPDTTDDDDALTVAAATAAATFRADKRGQYCLFP